MPSLSAFLLFHLPLAIAGAAIVYHIAVTVAALRFRHEKEAETGFLPPVSVLKPLRGIERDFYATLRTFFRQDYPQYEIVFGLSDENDPAKWTVEQLCREFPQASVKVVVAAGGTGSNPKMGKLQRMLEEASHEVLVMSDADIRIGPDYLRRVVGPLRDERVGMVTCLYRGVPAPGLLSKLEALGMSADFAGQVLLAWAMGEIRFALGATMATRKSQIAQIGGISAWADYLADDYILGSRIAAAGYRVHLSHTLVETVLPERTVREFCQQQVRWARTIRACSPRGYPGLLFAFGAPLALLACLYAPASRVAWGTLVTALILRWASGLATSLGVCRDRSAVRHLWLLPLRDLQALVIWLMGLFGSEIVWRQARYRLEPGGRIRPMRS